MREDMFKVIVERPRLGAGWARKGRKPARLGDYPLREGIGARGRSKNLNENLAPLKRYLERQVNRPWNKVYSEIRARIRPGNTVQEHVLTHIDQFIHRNVERVTPDARTPCGLRDPIRPWWTLRPGELYVDPKDGIIKKARRKVSTR